MENSSVAAMRVWAGGGPALA